MADTQRALGGVQLRPVVIAGMTAGVAFLMIEMAMLMMMGQSPWGPPRMMGAIVLGQSALTPPDTFNMVVVGVAMMLHLVLSIVYAFIFALIAGRLNMGAALAVGAVFGALIYAINFYGFTALFPWFAMARGTGSIAGHIAFGAILAFVYKLSARA
jgi:uncharacterized membrane protein YagU involved in acid resistance